MNKQFHQITWDDQLRQEWLAILRVALREDLGEAGDLTSQAVVPEQAQGRAALVAREPGVLAGLPAVEMTLREIDSRLLWRPEMEDAQPLRAGQRIGLIEGPARCR